LHPASLFSLFGSLVEWRFNHRSPMSFVFYSSVRTCVSSRVPCSTFPPERHQYWIRYSPVARSSWNIFQVVATVFLVFEVSPSSLLTFLAHRSKIGWSLDSVHQALWFFPWIHHFFGFFLISADGLSRWSGLSVVILAPLFVSPRPPCVGRFVNCSFIFARFITVGIFFPWPLRFLGNAVCWCRYDSTFFSSTSPKPFHLRLCNFQ